MGRRPIFDRPMTAAERKRRQREREAKERPPFEPAPVTPEYLASLTVTEEDWARLDATSALEP